MGTTYQMIIWSPGQVGGAVARHRAYAATWSAYDAATSPRTVGGLRTTRTAHTTNTAHTVRTVRTSRALRTGESV